MSLDVDEAAMVGSIDEKKSSQRFVFTFDTSSQSKIPVTLKPLMPSAVVAAQSIRDPLSNSIEVLLSSINPGLMNLGRLTTMV